MNSGLALLVEAAIGAAGGGHMAECVLLGGVLRAGSAGLGSSARAPVAASPARHACPAASSYIAEGALAGAAKLGVGD